MKKLLVFFGAIFLFSSIAFAAEDVGVVDLGFCTGLNHYVVTLWTWDTTHAVCMRIKNKGTQTSSISLSLVDGEFSHGDRPVQACKTNGNWFFGKSTAISWDAIVTLRPSEEVEKYVVFTKLTWYVGVLHGCIAYSVVDPAKVASNGPMSVLTRKANLIDITVPGKVTSNFYVIPLTWVAGDATKIYTSYGRQLAGDDKIKLFYQRRPGVLSTFMGIENGWFTDENYKIVTKVSSFFGLISWIDEWNEAQLYAQTNTVSDKVSYVPWYHLFVRVHVSIVHRPVAITPDTPQEEWQSINYAYSFFLVPWYYIILALILIIVALWGGKKLIVYIVKRRREHHQKEIQAAAATLLAATATHTSEKKVVKKTTTAPRKAAVKKKPKDM